MHLGEDGRLWAINPEAGFFGVAPGTSRKTNPTAMAMLNRDTIFTNVGLTEDRQPWWEGKGEGQPAIDWQGKPYDPAVGPAAHPNSRFTVSSKRCPSWTAEAESASGVPLTAIIFGGRRERLVPLVIESHSWQHGVLLGAAMASETTAAATGKVGTVRRDPMAMLPFCGYNFADYWAHWLSFANRSDNLPRIFHVNWFRKGENGKFLWPGFSENMRALDWIIQRCLGESGAVSTPIGHLPRAGDLNLKGLDVEPEVLSELLDVDVAGWRNELAEISRYFDSYGSRTPQLLRLECQGVSAALDAR
jgi:phosphoenolpyruvate carboxykinase (GTP)